MEPYIKKERVEIDLEWNPDYPEDDVCKCGHTYYRHFDTYDRMANVGCKYCECSEFEHE